MTEEAKSSKAFYSRVSCVEETIGSSDGVSNLRMKVWDPVDVTPKAIVQLVHGMAEHIDRYNDFAHFLAERGFVVVGHDHIGHGKSAGSAQDLGVMPLHGGKEVLIADVHKVRLTVQSCYDALPYFIFGHSMGSFVTRCYLAKYSLGVAGAIICGTGNQPLPVSLFGRSVARAIGTFEGEEHKSSFLETLIIGAFALPFYDEPSKNAWISSDPAVVASYDADPLSGITFSAGGFATLTDLSAEAALPKTSDIPAALPLLFIAGDKDPVGMFGKDVVKAAEAYRKQGSTEVEVRIYPGMRHEILNEPGNYRVYNDVVDWLKGNLQ